MTGYGKGMIQSDSLTVVAELKSLNGKTSDIRCRLPYNYKAQEITLRKLILEKAYRGKLEYTITIDSDQGSADNVINESLYKKYYKDIKKIESELGINNQTDYTQTILRIPNVVDSHQAEVTEEEINAVLEATNIAITNLNKYRADEGVGLLADLDSRSVNILDLLTKIEPYEKARIDKIKAKMKRNIEDVLPAEQMDQNRFEQEIVYYIEKLDINEEKVRLSQHCKYFGEILHSDTIVKGKKLGFVAQEMGREINTLGAKAQDKNIQQLVVSMKDELEKLKEQLFNIV